METNDLLCPQHSFLRNQQKKNRSLTTKCHKFYIFLYPQFGTFQEVQCLDGAIVHIYETEGNKFKNCLFSLFHHSDDYFKESIE